MSLENLSYARPDHPWLQRTAFRFIERVTGHTRFLRVYGDEFGPWLDSFDTRNELVWNEGLDRLKIERRLHGEPWPPDVPGDRPLVMVANHPYGVLDGVTTLALAERLGRPFRVLIDQTLLKFEPLRDYALPVDFTDRADARDTNIERHRAARDCLLRGETVIVFPGASGHCTQSVRQGRRPALGTAHRKSDPGDRRDDAAALLSRPGQHAVSPPGPHQARPAPDRDGQRVLPSRGTPR